MSCATFRVNCISGLGSISATTAPRRCASRNEHGDYTLMIDAGEVLELPPGFRMPHLNADSYVIENGGAGAPLQTPASAQCAPLAL